MKRCLCVAILSAALAAAAAGGQAEVIGKLEEDLKAAAGFEYGQDSGPLVRIEKAVVESAKDEELRKEVELRVINVLLASGTTRDAKGFLCRQLRTIGSARCIPALERFLSDAELSHMARYALGSMEGTAASAALRRALGRTSGNLQVGIINTLADRRCGEALADFIKLLGSRDSSVAEASARALGRVGGAGAVKALEGARGRASESLRQSIDNGLLFCAERFLAEGRTDDAARIYERFYSVDQPRHFRLAGLRGLALARGAEAAPVLVATIKDEDAELRRSAIGLMTTVQGEGATRAFVELLPSLGAEGQELVLGALGSRGDRSAGRAVSAATKSEHEAVRVAALEALGSVGDASAAVLLSYAAATGGEGEKRAARASLLRLQGDDVDSVLMRSTGSGDSRVRAEMIRALAGRGVRRSVDMLFRRARDADERVRLAAIEALGVLGGAGDLDRLVGLAVRPAESGDGSAIEEAIGAVFRRVADKESQARAVLDALGGAASEAKPVLLRLLGRSATEGALAAVRSAVKDSDAAVRDAAIRVLSEWPNSAPAEDLLVVARNSSNQAHKVLSLRGYVRMAGMSENATAMYVRALELAERAEDKKLVLGGLGTADSAEALGIAERYLKDERLEAEAGLAAVQIAGRLRRSDEARARAGLERVVATVKNTAVRQKAQDIINEMEQYEGYILVWRAAGPYAVKGKESRVVFDTAFDPEKRGVRGVEWKRLNRGVGSWDINLESMFGSKDHVCAYMRTRVWSGVDQKVRLELGSDDSVKVWLNGKLVHETYTSRGLSPRQDVVEAGLVKGWNDLILKVVDHEGGWAFCCRVRRPDGRALEGLKVEAR